MNNKNPSTITVPPIHECNIFTLVDNNGEIQQVGFTRESVTYYISDDMSVEMWNGLYHEPMSEKREAIYREYGWHVLCGTFVPSVDTSKYLAI